VINRKFWPLYLGEEPRWPLNRRLGGPRAVLEKGKISYLYWDSNTKLSSS